MHHYKLTRFSNRCLGQVSISNVLHHYKLTRFSNMYTADNFQELVLHHYKLTRFSNQSHITRFRDQFCTITNLQGSQTSASWTILGTCFAPLQTYKVLKHHIPAQLNFRVLHHYKLTRFSNENKSFSKIGYVLHHYKLTRFSNNLNFG